MPGHQYSGGQSAGHGEEEAPEFASFGRPFAPQRLHVGSLCNLLRPTWVRLIYKLIKFQNQTRTIYYSAQLVSSFICSSIVFQKEKVHFLSYLPGVVILLYSEPMKVWRRWRWYSGQRCTRKRCNCSRLGESSWTWWQNSYSGVEGEDLCSIAKKVSGFLFFVSGKQFVKLIFQNCKQPGPPLGGCSIL